MTRNPFAPLLALLLPLAACAPDAVPTPTSGPAPAATATSALTAREELRAGVRQLTSRDAANLKTSPGATAGTQKVRVEAGFHEVVLARVHADGTVGTRCVGSPGEADAFLDGTGAPAAPARADK